METTGLLFALITALCFAWSSLFMKRGMYKGSTGSGVLYTLIANAVMFLLASSFVFWRGVPAINITAVGFFLLSGFLGPVFGRFALYASIRKIGATRSASIKITAPVFSAVLAWALLGEMLSLQAALGIFVIIGGIYMVIANTGNNIPYPQVAAGGFSLAFVSAFFFAATNVARKAGLATMSSALMGSTISTVSALTAFVLYYSVKGEVKQVLKVSKDTALKFLIAGVLAGAALFSYFMALKFISVPVAMAVANIEPLFTILLAHLSKLDDEAITVKFIVSAVVVLLGVTLLVLD